MSEEKKEIVIPDPNCLVGAGIEAKAEAAAIGKTKTPMGRIFALAIMAGIQIGLGGMFMFLIKADTTLPFAASQVLGGFCFSLGLICVVIAGAELFTGNNLMVCAALSKKITWLEVIKNWVVVYAGNLIGSLVLVAIVFASNYTAMNGGQMGDSMVSIATAKINMPFFTLFCRGIVCNLLVCLAVWMGFAGKSVIDKIFTCIFPIMAFVACGFEHCIANMFILPMGFLAYGAGFGGSVAAAASVLNVGGIAFNICAVTLGNIVGGAIFVGVLYWLSYHKKEAK